MLTIEVEPLKRQTRLSSQAISGLRVLPENHSEIEIKAVQLDQSFSSPLPLARITTG